MTRIFWLFIIALCVAGAADHARADVTLLAGQSRIGQADDGTYWNETNEHAINLTQPTFGIRWDSERIASKYSVGIQYTNFGRATINALAVSADAPHPGGYDPATNSCVGPCAVKSRWVMSSESQSVTISGSRHFGAWSFEIGADFYETITTGYVEGSTGGAWHYPLGKYGRVEPMFGIAYQDGPWSGRFQYRALEGKGTTPSVSVGATMSLLLGYTF